MKTLYLLKTLLPFIFLPIAPGFLQIELARQGFLAGHWAAYVIAAQGIFTLGTIGWLGLTIIRQREKAFLRMSCVSKKVYFQGRWMTVEEYLAENHNIQVSHGMTPEESQAWVADAERYIREERLLSDGDPNCTLPEPETELEERAVPRQLQHSAA